MLSIINNNTGYTGKTFDSVIKFLNWKVPQIININENILIVVGYNEGKNIFEIKEQYPNHKIIIYQLEQLYGYQSLWFNPESTSSMVLNRTKHIKNWLDNVDVIWDYDLDNIEFLNSLGYSNIKHLSLEICDVVKFENNQRFKEYDIVFFGAINQKRYDILSLLDKKYNLLVICNQTYLEKNGFKFKNCIPFCYGQELYNHIFKAKIAINLHYYDTNIQEQVRLFELLSNNISVLSEKSKRNYLNVEEFNSIEELCNMIDEKLNNIKIGISYSTFYGLEFLEKHIPLFRNKVDYIVVVHQETSFYNNPEPLQNKEILKRLVDNKLIDDIYYYKNRGRGEVEMITKRNIGLEFCKKNNCDFIIPLDSDENYDFDSLITEIKFAVKNNIQTLYSPIRTFYHNINFYYDDCFYVPSVYKIDERIFGFSKTELIVDPHRKMLEKNYMVTETPMLHYNYLLETYEHKINDKIACSNIETKIIYEYLKNWKPGNPGMVFKLVNNKRIIAEQQLISLISNKSGYTSTIEIKNNQVVKKIKSSVSQYKINGLELFEREIFWLTKLDKYNISPKIISTDKNSLAITMEYCGEIPTKTDFESQSIQIQLLNILRVLMENHCYYNDFKIDNFTIKNNKLYIIDFGWCPIIKEDFTCENTIVTNLKEKPHKNIFELFDIFKQQANKINEFNSPIIKYKQILPNTTKNKLMNKYLTEKEYFQKIEEHKKINPEHWVTNNNNNTYQKRWEYHNNTIELLKEINPSNILEAGTMGIMINEFSDTIDLDLPTKGWRLTYKPTHNHDLRIFPWSNIKNKQYDCFVALRVFHHMKTDQEKYLNEMFRISNNVILAFPQSVANIYKNICLPTKEIKSINSDTTIIFYDKKTIENFKQPTSTTSSTSSNISTIQITKHQYKEKINLSSNYSKTITIITYGDDNSEISNKCLQSIKAQINVNKQNITLIDVKTLNIPKIIKELKTDYLMFLNKNDIISKNYISEMLKMFDIHTGLVYCPIQKFENVIEFINPNKDRNTFIWKNLYINSSAVLSTNYLKILNIYDTITTITIEDLFFQLNNISKIKKSLATQYVRLNETNIPIDFNALIHKNVKLTTGLIYSNRLGEQFFHKWINSLIQDVQILNNFSELIIVNNSTIELPINEYKKYFENIKIIKGTGNISKTKFSKDEYKKHLAEMLADSYNIIMEQAIGDLIHLREDDLISANNSFCKIYNTLIKNQQENLLGVSGIYLNRYNPDINNKINKTSIDKPTKLIKIGYTGTGYMIFWKELAPKFSAPEYKIKAHDWSWCDLVYKENKHLLIDISANVQHWIEIDKFIQHNNEDIIPSLTYSKINR